MSRSNHELASVKFFQEILYKKKANRSLTIQIDSFAAIRFLFDFVQ